MKTLTTLLFFLFSSLAGTSYALDRYTIGVEKLSYLPHYTVENGQYRGYARDVFDAFAKEKNIQFDYKPLPVERLFRELVTGEIDFKFPDSPFWNKPIKKGVKIHYSKAVAPYIDGVMVRPENLSFEQKNIRKLGTVTGFTPWAWMEVMESQQVQIKENPSFSGLLKQVMAGRIDGAYVNTDVARYFMNNVMNKTDALAFSAKLPHIRDSYFLSSKLHPTLIDAFNAWLGANQDFLAERRAAWGIGE